MDGMVIQLIGSAIAVAAMVALAAWARIARPVAELDTAAVARLLADDYPDHPIDHVWIAADGQGAIARSGDMALVLSLLGDSWVARDLPWDRALASPVRAGRVRLRLGDPGAPVLGLAVSGVQPWPPAQFQEAIAA